MRVIVVHEDGDRTSRMATLVDEIRTAVEHGSMRHLGVCVEVQSMAEDAISTDLDRFKLLKQIAGRISDRAGVLVRVKLAEYWVGGRQQTDHYTVTIPGECRGPMSFQTARDWLEGFGARLPGEPNFACPDCGQMVHSVTGDFHTYCPARMV